MSAHTSKKVQPVKNHSGWTRVIGVIVAVALILCTYVSIVQANFGTAAKATAFLKAAKVLDTTADIIKAEVNDKLPENIKNNFIQNAIAQKLLDIIVTPENLAKISEPALKLSYQVTTKAPTEVKDNKVVLETQQYKDQASKFVGQSKLPDVLAQPIDSIIQATPDQLTLVNDVRNSPNNPLVIMIQLRNSLRIINTAVTVLWWIIILGLLGIVALNWRAYRRILHTAVWIFGAAGLFLTVGSWVFPPVAQLLIPQSTDPIIGGYINDLIVNVTNYLFSASRSYGLFFLLIAVIAYVLKRFDIIAKVVALGKKLWVKYQPSSKKSQSSHHKSTHNTHSHKK